MHHGSRDSLGNYFYRKFEQLDRNLMDGYLDGYCAQVAMPLRWLIFGVELETRLNSLINGGITDESSPDSMEDHFTDGVNKIIDMASAYFGLGSQFLRFVDFVRCGGEERASQIAVCENPAYFQAC